MKLDDDLRHAVAAIQRIDVEPPDLDQVRRRRTRRTRRDVGALAGVIALVAAAYVVLDRPEESQQVIVTPPTTVAETPRVTVVPWVDVTTTTYVEPTMPAVPASAPPCRVDDLEVELGAPNQFLNGPTAHVIQFTNIGTAPCSLTGRPSVSATTSDGGTVIAAPGDLMPEIAGPVIATDVIPVGTRSFAPLWTSSECPEAPSATAIDVSFGDGKVTLVPAPSADDRADAERDGFATSIGGPIPVGCGLQIGAFSVATVGQSTVTPMSRLQFRVDTTEEVHPGETLVVTMTVRNTTDEAIPLDPCPDYQGAFQRNEGSTTKSLVDLFGRLRCEQIGSIQPGTSVAFKIDVAVPADASPGPAYLFLSTGNPMIQMIPPAPVTILPT